MLSAELQEGHPVEVIGTTQENLQSTQIRVLDINKLSAGTFFVFDGTITRFTGLDDFDVEYRPVSINADVRIIPAILNLGMVMLN